jgi:hypothetical protein
MIAEIPAPQCVEASSPFLPAIRTVRRARTLRHDPDSGRARGRRSVQHEALAALTSGSTPAPSFIVHSGYGLHAVWLLREPSRDKAQWREIQRANVRSFADPACAYGPRAAVERLSDAIVMLRLPRRVLPLLYALRSPARSAVAQATSIMLPSGSASPARSVGASTAAIRTKEPDMTHPPALRSG